MTIIDQASTRPQEFPANSNTSIISVIVPVFNRASDLAKCLESLRNCGECGDLIVVDDQSTEDIHAVATKYLARYFRTPDRQGPAGARNLGAQHARGEILLFVDADVVVGPDTLLLVKSEFDGRSELSAAFGSYDDRPAHDDFWSSYKNLLHHYVHQTSRVEAVTFWTGCGAILKRAFDATGGFDAAQYRDSSIEDVELGHRLTQQKYEIRLVKQLQVKHLKKWTMKSVIYTDVFHRAVPWTRLILRAGSIPQDLNLTWTSRVSAVLVAMAGILASALLLSATRLAHWPTLEIAAAMLLDTLLLVLLNRALYQFFWRKRGTIFTLGAILAHWSYLFYSGITFTICCAADFFGRSPDASPATTEFRPASRSNEITDSRPIRHYFKT